MCDDSHMVKASSSSIIGLPRLDTFEIEGHTVDVLVPIGVNKTTPILVTHDGQNYLLPAAETWNGQNWGLLEAIDAGRIVGRPAGMLPLIASVHNRPGPTRVNELGPEDIVAKHPEIWDTLPAEIMPPTRELLGNEYQAILAEKVLPELAARYGVLPAPERTAIGGSSMGGLASLYAMAKYPSVWGTALCYSTHWPFGGETMVRELIGMLPAAGTHRVWTDCGTEDVDSTYRPFHDLAIKEFEKHGWLRDRDFVASVWPGTGHQEHWWAKRIEVPINWWLHG